MYGGSAPPRHLHPLPKNLSKIFTIIPRITASLFSGLINKPSRFSWHTNHNQMVFPDSPPNQLVFPGSPTNQMVFLDHHQTSWFFMAHHQQTTCPIPRDGQNLDFLCFNLLIETSYKYISFKHKDSSSQISRYTILNN